MLAWTHTWERVYAHTCCLDMYACMYAQPHTNTVWIWTCTREHETHVCKCVSHHLLSVHISTYLQITGTSAQLCHADEHGGISQPTLYHKQKNTSKHSFDCLSISQKLHLVCDTVLIMQWKMISYLNSNHNKHSSLQLVAGASSVSVIPPNTAHLHEHTHGHIRSHTHTHAQIIWHTASQLPCCPRSNLNCAITW